MSHYRYIGAGPDVDPVSNTIVHPGDVWSFTEEPAFGRWQLIGKDPESSEKPSKASDSSPARSHADEAENAPTGQPEPHDSKEA